MVLHALILQEPWPDFPGFGALSIKELQQSTRASNVQPVPKVPEILPSPIVQSLTKAQAPPRGLNVESSPRKPSSVHQISLLI